MTQKQLVEYAAFFEFQADGFVLDPKAEKRKQIAAKARRMIEMDEAQAKHFKGGR